MPELVEQIAHIKINFWVYAALAASVSARYWYKSVVGVGDHLSRTATSNLSQWLSGETEAAWTQRFCGLFDCIFGDQHLSVKCFLRSAIASLVTVSLLYVVIVEIFGLMDNRALGELSWLQAILFGAAINVIPDYFSLLQTRWVLSKFNEVSTAPRQIILIVLDLSLSALIITSSINLFRIINGESVLNAVELLALFSIYSIFFYSTFFTSIWAWGYAVSTLIQRSFSKTGLKYILDIENNPAKQMALISSAIVFIAILIIALVMKKDDVTRVSKFDNFLCSVIDNKTCVHLARTSSDNKNIVSIMDDMCAGKKEGRCFDITIDTFNRDYERALSFLSNNCEYGDSLSCTYAGLIHSEAQNNSETQQAYDPVKGAYYFQKACDGDEYTGCALLGSLYLHGSIGPGVAQDKVRATSFSLKACDGGVAYACGNLAFMYTESDEAKAANLLSKACAGTSLGFNEVNGPYCNLLGTFYETGRGVDKDFSKAVSYHRIACNKFGAYGCTDLGLSYQMGRGVKRDIFQAVQFFRKACDGGRPEGCFQLGLSYDEGLGISKDIGAAVSRYRQACDGGWKMACHMLGKIHSDGRGVAQNLGEAASYYMKACDAGDAYGCHNIGAFNFAGIGVEQDINNAKQLFVKACEMGSSRSCGDEARSQTLTPQFNLR